MHRPTHRRRTAAIAAALLLASVATPAAADTETNAQTETLTASVRYAGDDRQDTAGLIAEDYATPEVVIVANGDNFPDALAAAFLARGQDGPVLLNRGGSLNDRTRQAILDSGVDTVLIVGGTAAVPEAVANQIRALAGVDTVTRISGDNRYETAEEIATFGNPTVGTIQVDGTPKRTAILATGVNFPDALAAGATAWAGQLPILLTTPDTLHPAAASAIDQLLIQHVIIAGGPAAVGEAVRDAAAARPSVSSTQRIQGDDRNETAAAFAAFNASTLAFDDTQVGLAFGRNFPDALSLGPLAGQQGFSILLSEANGIPTNAAGAIAQTSTAEYLASIAENNPTIVIAGGDAVVPPSVAAAARQQARSDDPPPPMGEVTTTADSANATSGSLRAAITFANGNAGPDTITLASGATYTLSIAGDGEDGNATGDLDVTDDLTIVGNGATIDADGLGDRVMEILGANVTLTGVTFANGDTPDADDATGFGGGVRVADGGSLDMTGGAFENNTASKAGGGLEVAGAGTSATLTDVDFTGNAANGDAPATAANGGAIHSTGTVDVTGGTVSGNAAALEGGGFWQGAGTMTVDGTEFYGNSASGPGADQGGGALFVINGTLDVSNSTIGSVAAGQGNAADGAGLASGGAILVDRGTLTLSDSNVSGNRANRAGGGIELVGEAVEGDTIVGTATISNTTFRGNNATGTAPPAAPGNGGALHVTGPGDVTVSESLLTFNTASNEGGGLWNGNGRMLVERSLLEGNRALVGGGLFNQGGFLDVVNTTLAENTLFDDVGASGTQAVNGTSGIQTTFQFVTLVENDTSSASTSIVNDNPTTAYGSFTLGNSAIDGDCTGVVFSASSNVVADGDCLFDGGAAGDQQGVDPELGGLAPNGGLSSGVPGETEVIRSYAPAGAGNLVDAAGSSGSVNVFFGGGVQYTVDVDQRGQPRGQNGDGAGGSQNDVGAFEVPAT